MEPITHVAMEPVIQKSDADCAIAALAMASGYSYSDLSRAARTVLKNPHQSGMWITEMKRVVKKLGITLKVVTPQEALDIGTGLWIIKFLKTKEYHCVTLFRGTLIDPLNGVLWEPETYLATMGKEHGTTRAVNGVLLYETRRRKC